MGSESTKVLSIVNFNPVALFSLILLLIGLILGAVGTGLDRWSYLETERISLSAVGESEIDMISKSQGLFRRCINYEVSSTLDLGDPPQDGCLEMGSLDCSLAGPLQLISALDIAGRNELQNSDNPGECSDMKTQLQVSGAFMIMALLATFVAIVLFFPLWHWIFFIFAAIAAVVSVVFFAIGLGTFANLELDYAGFFSTEGQPQTGCLWYGFGVALAAFLINIIASVIGCIAICYRRFMSWERSKYE